jgi:maltooligosyltrehalose trehalohydrolase
MFLPADVSQERLNNMEIGARYLGDGRCEFAVWAPLLNEVSVKVIAPESRLVAMAKDERGYWRATVEGVGPGARYFYLPGGGKERPDPASHFQPEGVHGPSEVVDHSGFRWGDEAWAGVALESKGRSRASSRASDSSKSLA